MKRTTNLEMPIAWALLSVALTQGLGHASVGRAQTETAAPEWQPISDEELAFKDDPTNPGASAVILYREVTTDDVNSVETHFYRIKILTEAGKDYGDIVIPYREKVDRIEGIRARTVQPDGSAAEFNGEVFDKLVVRAKKVRFQAKTFTLPGVRPGCIIEYSYQTRWRGKFPEVLKDPSQFIMEGSDALLTAQWVIPEDIFIRRARFSIRPLPRARLIWNTVGLRKDSEPQRQSDGSVVLAVTNVPAFTEEPFMPPERMFKTRVDFFYVIGSSAPSDYWLSRIKAEAPAYEKFIGNSKDIQRVVDQTVSRGDPPATQLRKLYDRAQQVRFVSFESVKTEQEARRENLKENKNADDVLKHGYAYVNQINLLFVAMARAAGFQSAPALLTGRDEGVFQQSLLDRSQLNAMVAWVKVGSTDRYFDPATRFCPYNILPWNETAAGGVLVEGLNSAFIKTPSPPSEDAVIERKASLRLDNEGALEGKLLVRFTGQEALERRLENRERDEAGRRRALEDEVKRWLPGGSTAELNNVGKWEEAAESFEADFTIKIANYGASTRRRLLLPLAVMESTGLSAFQSSKRTHAILFPYPFQELDEIRLEVPAGRQVEALPAPRTQSRSFGSYKASYESEGGAVTLKRQMVVSGLFLEAEDYPQLKTFFEDVRAGDEEPVVLRNAQ